MFNHFPPRAKGVKTKESPSPPPFFSPQAKFGKKPRSKKKCRSRTSKNITFFNNLPGTVQLGEQLLK